jgi:hypothetical protein
LTMFKFTGFIYMAPIHRSCMMHAPQILNNT